MGNEPITEGNSNAVVRFSPYKISLNSDETGKVTGVTLDVADGRSYIIDLDDAGISELVAKLSLGLTQEKLDFLKVFKAYKANRSN